MSASDVCDRASWCEENTIGLFASSESDSGPGGAGLYDIAHPLADPFPPPHMNGYLAESRVQAQLGVPVNFTAFSMAVGEAFASTYDNVHGGFLTALGHLLDGGVKVHLVYGDRDYICNWVGGEEASLAVPYSRRDEFASAPYGPFEVDGRLEGITRQLGNYSFTRVFQAGHMVPSYQPRAAHELFRRATFNRDIGTGKVAVGDDLVSEPARGVHRWMPSERPPRPEPECYVLWPSSCTPEVWERVVAGEAVIRDYFVVGFDDSFDEL